VRGSTSTPASGPSWGACLGRRVPPSRRLLRRRRHRRQPEQVKWARIKILPEWMSSTAATARQPVCPASERERELETSRADIRIYVRPTRMGARLGRDLTFELLFRRRPELAHKAARSEQVGAACVRAQQSPPPYCALYVYIFLCSLLFFLVRLYGGAATRAACKI
jgi:hypothetical protein